MKVLKEWGPFVLIILIALLLRIYVWKPVIVEGHSMDPTLADKERLIIVKTMTIKRQKIVVAKEYDRNSGKEKNIVKRVIGLPGDTIKFDADVLTINGKVVEEPYLKDYKAKFSKDKLQETFSYNGFFQELAQNAAAFTISATGETNFTVTVPKGQYFLMGDDRLVSQDSRQVGAFSKKDLVGEVKLRIWPIKKIGTVD
ncbi:signal peptidase I [Lactococcus carnosus]|uniref:signal peptidase I n=1 Tax=Pseudolactococcus carnosus TaxID=2749961 RepID=UPI00081225F8|nr:signal peptidase I [Lactococcus carnosus]SCA93058.1 Signal peptidase I [Lactococcus piscium]MCJ1969870.1 signal peptidase I [Lactococcus carnosus]MCJ1973901.1 signal peptidase I [Lactococcus carnosus]MCJ1975991.1 signal peptidase I [Lactococcus carnosus]MCJ1982186.1 signal peptidase I [Lactococcus carnosus]